MKELIPHGFAEDEAHSAQLALHAGLDMDMVSGVFLNTLGKSFAEGKISKEELDEAARRVLRIKHRAGLFDHPYTDAGRAARDILAPEARTLARKLAHESMVLLKNENNLLPLQGFRRILVAGSFIHARAEQRGIVVRQYSRPCVESRASSGRGGLAYR